MFREDGRVEIDRQLFTALTSTEHELIFFPYQIDQTLRIMFKFIFVAAAFWPLQRFMIICSEVKAIVR